MNPNFTYRGLICLIFLITIGLSSHSQVNISPNGNFHMESDDIYFSDDVPTFTNKLFYALPNGSGPVANFPAMGARYQGDGSRYSDRTAWYSYSGNGYITGTFSFVPQYDQENNPITVNQLVTYCGRRPNTSGNCKYTDYKYNSFIIQVEVPDFLNTDGIKILCNTQAPIQIANYFKSTITGVTFKVDGIITSTIEPGSLSLGEHVVTAEKFYNNGNYTGEFRFTILEKPVAVITPNGSTNICEGSNVVLSAPVSPTGQVYTYQWSTGQTSKDISVSSAGNYTVTISNGACSSTSPSVSVSTKPVPDRYVNVTGNTSICDGETSTLTASNAKSYLWYKDGVATSITTQTINISTAGSYSCVLTGDNGCSVSTNPTVITVKPNPKPTISVTGSLTFCDGDKVILTAQSTGIPNNYQWSNGQSGQTIQVSTSGIYSVTATNPGSCQSTSIPVVVNVLPNPKPTITAVGPTSFCAGDGVKLIASPGKSYQWSSGETTQEIFVKTPGTFSVEVQNTNSCIRVSDPTIITVKQRPTPSIVTEGSLSLCAGQTVKLTSSITGDAYLWFPNGETTQSINVANAGTYYVQVFKDGCSGNSESRTVTVTNPVIPTIQNLNGSNTPCYGEIVTLQASFGQSFLWSTGETSQAIQITQGGTYFVTTKDAKGCSAVSQSIRIIYKNQFSPIVTASGNTTVCDGDGVILTATTGKSYLWSNGATTQSVTVFASGAFTCKVTNSEDCTVETPPVAVTVNQRPKPSIVSLSSTTFCQGSSVTLSVGDPVGGANYTWSNGKTGQSIVVTTAGLYSVTASYTNGCIATSENIIVNVLPIVEPTITASGPLTFCEGGNVILTINESGDNYLWSTGETTKSITVFATGNYTATITNNNGCSLTSIPVNVVSSPRPKPNVTASGPLSFCSGGNVTLTVSNPQPGANYSWSDGQNGQSILVNTSGNYTVTASYQNGCSAISDASVVQVQQIVTPTITASGPLTFCEGGSVTLTINETGDKYLWSTGETTRSITVSATGSYTGTIVNNNGCSRISLPVNVVASPRPKPTITASGPLTFCQGGTVTLTVSNPVANVTYTWSNGLSGQSIVASISGSYSVGVVYENGCSEVSSASVVNVLPVVKPTITASGPLTFCEGGSVILSVNEIGDKYLWSTGETTKSITVSTTGSYTATIQNNNDCSLSSEAISVTTLAKIKPIVALSTPSPLCEGEKTTLYVSNPEPGANYTWNNGKSGSSIEVTESGNYTVFATYTNSCSTVSDIVPVEFYPIPKPTITADNTSTVCEGTPLRLTINENAVNYRWSTGETTRSIEVTKSGSYVAYIKNAQGCERASDPTIITVLNNKIAGISVFGKTNMCEGEKATLTASQGTSYVWSTGETTRSIVVSTSGVYNVEITNAAGCKSNSEDLRINVYPIPKPTIQIIGSTELCAPNTVTLTIKETGTAYRWSNGATTKSITVGIGGTYTAFISNTQGCERESEPVTVTVRENPEPIITASSSTTFCEGGKVVLSVPNTIGYTYLWNTGETKNSIEVTKSGDYYVQVKNDLNCERFSANTKVVVFPISKPSIAVTGLTEFCQPGSATLTIKETGTSYRWSNGATTKSITVTESGTFTAYIKNAEGCERESDPVVISVKPNEIPVITASSNTTFCEGDKITLSVPNKLGETYTWSTGETTNSIVVDKSGDYFIKVKNSEGCERLSATTKVTVYPISKPTINLSGPVEFCQPGSVTLTIKENGSSYRWSNGETTKSIVVSSSGSFTAFIINAQGCERASDPVVVTVKPNEVPVITASSNTTFCEGDKITLSVPNKLGETYSWSTGETTNSIVVDKSGDYFIKVRNSDGCERISGVTKVVVNAIPKPTITLSGPAEFCQPGSVTLTIKETAPSYRWSNGATTKSITVTESGTFTAYIKNIEGCERVSEPVTITVRENIVPVITASSSTTFCEGEKITLSVPNVVGQTYLWNGGQTTNSIEVSASGDYFVKVKNLVGCESYSAITKVVVNAIPKPTIVLTGQSEFCQPDNAVLTIKENGASYRWSNGATTKSITVNESGTYIAYIKNAEGCERVSEPMVITVRDNPVPVIRASSSTTFCEGDKITLSVPNAAGQSYQWSSGETTNSIEVSKSGEYFVKVKNAAGCERFSAITPVTVHPIPKPTVTLSGSTDFCQPASVTLTIKETAASYRWSNGATSKSITVTESGTYTAFIKNIEGCERSGEPVIVNVRENTMPKIEASSNTTFCEGEKIILSVPNVIGQTYLWSNGQTTNSIEVSTSGDYSVKVRNAEGCERISEVKKVVVHPIPKPTIMLSGTNTFCQPDNVVLTIKEDGTSYRWSNGATTRSITVRGSGIFTAYIKNAEGCERASDPVAITVKENLVPVITPSSSTTFCEGNKITLSVPNKLGESYLWNTGETSNKIEVDKAGEYFIKVKNSDGCERLSEITNVVVYSIPKPTILLSGPSKFCQPDSVILTIKENGTAYRWSSGETTKSITVKASGTYKAYIKNAEGCERESDPVSIEVKDNPIPFISAASNTTFCEGGKVTLSVPAVIGQTYQWNTGSTNNTIDVTTSGDYFVRVKNADGCERQSEITKVVVHPIPKPTAVVTGNLIFCEGDSVILTIKEEGANYRWSTGAKTRSITVKTSETIIGFISNAEGCERATEPIITTAKPNPIPIITASGKTTICDGEKVTLTASLGVSYLWSNGATTRSITVDAPGDYFVTVNNAQSCGRTSAITKVIVLANDTPIITSSLGVEFCSGSTTVLTASEGTFYRWSTGETTQQISVNKSGSYTVTVINANNCARESAPIVLTVRIPTLLKRVNDFETCVNGGNVNLDSKNIDNPLTGVYVGKAVVGTIFNPASAGLGTHKIEYTYTNQYGCVSKTDFTVTVVDLTVLEIDPDIAVCETSANIMLLNGKLPVGVTASGTGVTNNVFKPSEAGLGKHIIQYKYTNGSGCQSSATRVIEVVATPSAPEISGSLEGCDGDVLTLTASATVEGNSQLTYLWYKKGIPTPFAEGQLISYTLNTSEIIYVSARAANVSSCESSLTEIKLKSNNPLGDFSVNATRIPLAGLVKLTPAVTGAVKYTWDFGDGGKSSDQNAVHYYYKAGKYTVTMIAYSSQGCPLIITKKEHITVDEDKIIITPPGNDSNPILQNKDAHQHIVYPNPIKDATAKIRIFNMDKQAQKATVQIYTIGQRLISSQVYEVNPGQNDFDLKDLHLLTGGKTYYLFTININNQQTTIKVLIL